MHTLFSSKNIVFKVASRNVGSDIHNIFSQIVKHPRKYENINKDMRWKYLFNGIILTTFHCCIYSIISSELNVLTSLKSPSENTVFPKKIDVRKCSQEWTNYHMENNQGNKTFFFCHEAPNLPYSLLTRPLVSPFTRVSQYNHRGLTSGIDKGHIGSKYIFTQLFGSTVFYNKL